MLQLQKHCPGNFLFRNDLIYYNKIIHEYEKINVAFEDIFNKMSTCLVFQQVETILTNT